MKKHEKQQVEISKTVSTLFERYNNIISKVRQLRPQVLSNYNFDFTDKEIYILVFGEMYADEMTKLTDTEIMRTIFTTMKMQKAEVDMIIKEVNNAIEVPKYQNEAWFKVGLLLANGEMYDHQKKTNDSMIKIAKHFFGEHYKKYRPTISNSLINHAISDKNIFNNIDKINLIKDFLKSTTLDHRFKKAIQPK